MVRSAATPRVSNHEATELECALARRPPQWATSPRGRVESTSRNAKQDEFPKGCRHKRPHTFHRIALVWSNRNEVWARTSSIHSVFKRSGDRFALRKRVKSRKRFQAKWRPVRVKKTRQIKNLGPRFNSIETEKALA